MREQLLNVLFYSFPLILTKQTLSSTSSLGSSLLRTFSLLSSIHCGSYHTLHVNHQRKRTDEDERKVENEDEEEEKIVFLGHLFKSLSSFNSREGERKRGKELSSLWRKEIFQKHPLSTRLSYFTTHKTHSFPP